jgi:HPt (histidine-containing phosphotransfer) domain-containing protein
MLTQPAGRIARSTEARADLQVYGAAEQISFQQLASLAEEVQSATRSGEEIVVRRGKADLTTRLEPSSWSIAECFDHLAQTTCAFLPAIAHAVATASHLTTNRPLRTGTLARLFIRNLEPPYRLRFKVLPQLRPQRQDFDAAWGGFLESQSQLLQTLRSAAGLAIDKVKIESPVYVRISYNLYGAFRMLTAHERRHLWQIEQILRTLDRRRRACAAKNPSTV